jgi:hypothetical protein
MIRPMAEQVSQQRVLSLVLTGFPFHYRHNRQHQNGTKLMIYQVMSGLELSTIDAGIVHFIMNFSSPPAMISL